MNRQKSVMSKIMALDLGDAWTGVALTDTTGMFVRPHTTVATEDLEHFLTETFSEEQIDTIVIGYPKTMKGGESEQTLKIVAHKQRLADSFSKKEFILWDERLSSRRAEALASRRKSREEKLKTHARAAAFILDSYIMYLRTKVANEETNVDRVG